MANVRDSDTSLWLHNKLGTSNDSWISGSICSQLNKEVLRNIKECFPDLQTQVKQKLLLSFFHIPRRLVEEWKTELDEVIEVAGLDTELWVAMLAEMMKTFPATSSLNTEISDYEDTRPIFTDMVGDLRKLVSKHSDLGMLPLECQYLNKNALVSVVGQQQNPVKHFTLKRKPKSANLRTELLHKSADAQSSLKKNSAPTIPLRSRGMPRKMTDTTPLKGIPSRVPTSGFRSPNVANNQQRPNLSRTPAGRKDGGIKLIELSEQPLGYAAAKKRKREQQLEEQQKKQEQKQNAAAAAANNTSPTASPSQTGSASAGGTLGTPTTPTSANASFEIKTESSPHHLGIGNSTDESSNVEHKDVLLTPTVTAKSEPSTPDYAASLTYTQTNPAASLSVDSIQEDVKPVPKTIIPTTHSSTVITPKVMSTSVQTQSNSNTTLNHTAKRIKQEIEIKSEEIIVPAAIKVEKIEPQTQPQPALVQQTPQQVQLQQTQMPRLQQRVIIQQQHQPQIQQQQQQSVAQQSTGQHVLIRTTSQQKQIIGSGVTLTSAAARQNSSQVAGTTTIKMEKLDIKPLTRTVATSIANNNTTSTTILTPQQLRQAANPLANLPNNISVKITSTKATKAQSQLQQQQQAQQQQPILINSSTPVILASTPSQAVRQKQLITSTAGGTTATTQTIKSMPLSQLKNAANNGPVIISQTIIQPAGKRAANATAGGAKLTAQSVQQQQQQQQTTTQYILTSSSPQSQQQQNTSTAIPSLTSFAQVRTAQQSGTSIYQTATGNTPTSTKILLKTSPSSGLMMTPVRQQTQTVTVGNPPPLIATSATQQSQQPTLLNIQNIQNVQLPNRPVTIQPASQAAQQQHLQAQLQQQQAQQQQQQPQHTIVANTSATQQPKLTQVLMQPNAAVGAGVNSAANVKNKTIILTQKGVILRNIGGDMYQQIPISNVSGLQGLTNATTGATLMTTTAGPPSLVKTTSSNMQQPQTIQVHQQQTNKPAQLPTLIPTNTIAAPQLQIVQQQPSQVSLISSPSQQTIIRPVMANVQGGLTTLPQGLTLIQRPGQQPQLVQVQTAPATQQRTIITQPAVQQQQLRPQQIVLQHKSTTQPRLITTTTTPANNATVVGAGGQPQQIQIQSGRTTHIVQMAPQPQSQPTTQQPQRKGLSLSNEHVHKAHEMFRKANRVSRPDKALILGFMAGLRENPRPNSENVIIIKLGETEEKVQQEDGSTALCLVESHIRLDYNTGEWKTFQNYRRLDQNTGGQQGADNGGTVMQAQNSVVI